MFIVVCPLAQASCVFLPYQIPHIPSEHSPLSRSSIRHKIKPHIQCLMPESADAETHRLPRNKTHWNNVRIQTAAAPPPRAMRLADAKKEASSLARARAHNRPTQFVRAASGRGHCAKSANPKTNRCAQAHLRRGSRARGRLIRLIAFNRLLARPLIP